MDEIASVFIFIVMMALVFIRQWLIDQKNKKRREREGPIHTKAPSVPQDTFMPHPVLIEKPHPVLIEKPQPIQAEVKPRYSLRSKVRKRELSSVIETRHLTTRVDFLETPELTSTRFAGEYIELSCPQIEKRPTSKIAAVLRSQKRVRDVIILNEILKNPYL